MRGVLVVAVVIGGCYRPTDPACVISCTQGVANACPSDLVCGSSSLCEPTAGPTCAALFDARQDTMAHDDADVDSSTDGPTTPDCGSASFTANPTPLFMASQYTPNIAHTRFSILGSNDVRVNESAPDSANPSDYVSVLPTPEGSVELYSSRIDPGGTVIYVSTDNGPGMTLSLGYVSRRTSVNVWQPYEAMSFRATGGTGTINLAIGATIGGSTDPALGPRRLPISYGDGQRFDEFRELSSLTTFEYLRTWTITDLGVLMVRDPSFTPDGLRLVYIGQVGADSGIYLSTRASLTGPWGPPVLLHAGTSSEYTPYLTQDCQHLYWTQTGITQHATHM